LSFYGNQSSTNWILFQTDKVNAHLYIPIIGVSFRPHLGPSNIIFLSEFPFHNVPKFLVFQSKICVSRVVNASNLSRTLYSKVEGGGFQSLPLIGASHCYSRPEKSLVTATAIFEAYQTAVMRRNLELVLLQGVEGSNYTILSGE